MGGRIAWAAVLAALCAYVAMTASVAPEWFEAAVGAVIGFALGWWRPPERR